MAHLQYMPGDPRLVDQLVYELKSKGIFDQFRKDCIADVDTRPAYQNLRQRVENSVSSFLSRQVWKPDLNKNQLREKLRKHILDGNYLEQGVERIVDQVVNPKVASVFIPQVEDLVYNYLGISRKKSVTAAETSNGKLSTDDLLPEDLEAVSPGSVKSNEDKAEAMDQDNNEENKMEVDIKDEHKPSLSEIEKPKLEGDSQNSVIELITDSDENDKTNMTMHEDIKLENIPAPDNSPPKAEAENIDIEKIELPISEVPHPDEIPLPKDEKETFFKPIVHDPNSDDDSSSDSSLRRNMSPLTPIRNYNNENSCDAQQAFENDSDSKSNDKKEPSSFRFAIEAKSPENNSLEAKPEKKDPEQTNLAYQFNNQVNINTFNTPLYDDSSNSNNLQIDYESDVNSKINAEKVPEADQNSEDKRDKKNDERKSSHKSSHRSRDSHRHSSSKDKRSDSKQSTSRDSSRHDKKPKDDHSKSKSSRDKEREKSRERSDKKDSRDSSKHRSSSHKSSSSHRDSKDSKSHRSSSSSQKHSSDKRSSDDKKSSTSHKSERSSEKSSDRSSRDKRDSKSGSHRSDKDKKSSSKSKHDEKDKKKDKKDTDDHYSLSGRGNHSRRSTDRDSNDGSSSSKGSQNQSGPKPTENKKETKGSSSKSENTSTASESASPSDKDHRVTTASGTKTNQKPIRVENHLETPITSPPRLPFVPDVTLKKPKFAANLAEAKRMMKMRKFLDEEQKRMNQEAALLLEFQANVRPSLSQVYSSIPGPELEFACIANEVNSMMQNKMCKTEHEEDENKSTNESKATEPEKNEKEIKKESTKNEDKNKVTTEIIDELEDTLTNDTEMFDDSDTKLDKSETYNENKPFSQLMEEISEYSKASEKNKKDALDNLVDDENKKRTEFFEVTVITEELSETDEPANEPSLEAETDSIESIEIEVPLTTETLISEQEITKADVPENDSKPEIPENPKPEEDTLKYFAEHEKFDAELKRHQYSDFLKAYSERNAVSDKIHIINCDTYEENILKEVCATFGTFEVINYYKNGHLKLPKTEKKVVKNVSLASEISLPVDNTFASSPSPVFSPVKSECSFELSSDYDAKLEEMVNKTSRQQVMEIILGNVVDDENPSIDYCTESSIDNELHLKRKLGEVESAENNNRQVLKKMRKLSDSDQISSTTEESEEVSNNNRVSRPTRSKYLGRARRVGLARPRRNNLPNSPSSDKSVENYEQNTQTSTQTQAPNGKFKSVTRNKVQRYDTSDLYKPKLHYLSRRNNIS